MTTPVASMVTDHGQRDWGKISAVVPDDILRHIAAVRPPNPASGEDTLIWRWEDKHVFSIRSAYKYLVFDVACVPNGDWKCIWSKKISQRVRVFLWVITGFRFANFMVLPFEKWFMLNIRNPGDQVFPGRYWDVLFPMICWQLWKRRCSILLDANYNDLEDLLLLSFRLADEFVAVVAELHMRSNPKGNEQVADMLACLARDKPYGEVVFTSASMEVSVLLSQEQQLLEVE
ncbi:hypothetical protein V6N12_058982 [Hibiscus sabdariffa]|uniref:Reverse transcriptase zinc-binding domain-containing protein n=1 Tax=Hibiscus sabdariffa TaxID=183260 RepID=A0ABR2ETQ6_9ROSI